MNKATTGARLFTIGECGDPYSVNAWVVREYKNSFAETVCVYRGDLSPIRGKRRAVETLRRLYPGCRIRLER